MSSRGYQGRVPNRDAVLVVVGKHFGLAVDVPVSHSRV